MVEREYPLVMAVVESLLAPETEAMQAAQQGGKGGNHARHSPRPGRTNHRPLLRTAFRNFSGVATVVVGEPNHKSRPQTEYLVHKELLTAASPFFAAALNGTFAEGLDQVVRLPEEKPESFEWFLQWLYTGTLTTQPICTEILRSRSGSNTTNNNSSNSYTITTNPNENSSFDHHNPFRPLGPLRTHSAQHDEVHFDGDLRNTHGSPKYFLLLDLYALSDRLLTPTLSNHILNTVARLSEATNSVPTPSDTWLLYDALPPHPCALRALILDLFAYKKTDKLLDTHKDDWHPRFLRDLCVKLKRPGGKEAIARHTLVAWRPRSWSGSRACEGCREVVRPMASGDKCCACERVFCAECVRRHAGGDGAGIGSGAVWMGDLGGCKPWMGKGMCLRYHEHADGETCY